MQQPAMRLLRQAFVPARGNAMPQGQALPNLPA
jgi:hypothetical protein